MQKLVGQRLVTDKDRLFSVAFMLACDRRFGLESISPTVLETSLAQRFIPDQLHCEVASLTICDEMSPYTFDNVVRMDS